MADLLRSLSRENYKNPDQLAALAERFHLVPAPPDMCHGLVAVMRSSLGGDTVIPMAVCDAACRVASASPKSSFIKGFGAAGICEVLADAMDRLIHESNFLISAFRLAGHLGLEPTITEKVYNSMMLLPLIQGMRLYGVFDCPELWVAGLTALANICAEGTEAAKQVGMALDGASLVLEPLHFCGSQRSMALAALGLVAPLASIKEDHTTLNTMMEGALVSAIKAVLERYPDDAEVILAASRAFSSVAKIEPYRAKLIDADVTEVLVSILTRHFGDSDIREPAFECLQQLLGDGVSLTKLMESRGGGMTVGLNVLRNAMSSNDETGARRALDMVRDLWEQSRKTEQDRRKLVDAGFFPLLESLMSRFPNSAQVQGGVGALVYALAGDTAMKKLLGQTSVCELVVRALVRARGGGVSSDAPRELSLAVLRLASGNASNRRRIADEWAAHKRRTTTSRS